MSEQKPLEGEFLSAAPTPAIQLPGQFIPKELVEPMNVLTLTQQIRLASLVAGVPLDKDTNKTLKDADANALGQMRIQVDKDGNSSQAAMAQAIVEAIRAGNGAGDPFLAKPGNAPAFVPPQLSTSVNPTLVVTDENLSTQQGSPSYEEIMGS
jgi:hypothetical protein